MPSAVVYGQGGGGTSTLGNAGSIFGLDEDTAGYPLVMDPSRPRFRQDDPAGGNGPSVPKIGTVLLELRRFHEFTPEQRSNAVEGLRAAGYLASNIDSKGRVKKTNPTAVDSAWKNAVLDAARAGVDVTSLLQQRIADNEADTAGNGPGSGNQPKLATNPFDVAALGDRSAQSGLGQDLTDPQQAELLAQFRATENPYLPADATTSEPGSAGWAQWADQHVREFDPTRFDARKVVSGVDVLRRWLAGQHITDGN